MHEKIDQFIDFKVDEDLLEITDQVYTESRYPGDTGMLPEGKPSLEAVEELYQFAAYILKQSKKMLKQ